jgi:hypothetical protein
MTPFYIKNTDTSEILELEADSYESLSKNFRQAPFELIEGKERDALILKEKKASKISQMKANRDASLDKPMVSIKALEYGTDKKVYFKFKTKATGNTATEPSTILDRALNSSSVKYSCSIIEGEKERKGYVEITKDVAQSLSSHLQVRAISSIQHSNDLAEEINAIKIEDFKSLDDALDKLNNININF